MSKPLHPRDALFGSSVLPRLLPACEHYAGNEKFLTKALQLQESLGVLFDLTCDLEDGAPRGEEDRQLEMILDLMKSAQWSLRKVGVRVPDISFPAWRPYVLKLLDELADRLLYITVPKVHNFREARDAVYFIQSQSRERTFGRFVIPLHIIIETPGALRDVYRIANLQGIEVLDFGHMDFISSFGLAIPECAMRSPQQFEHVLLRRAKSEICAAALAHGIIPAHNVTIDVSSGEQAGLDARRAKSEFGFLRMWSIHPDQIQPITEAFLAESTDIARAGAVLLQAYKVDWGPTRFEDRLYDRASYRLLWSILEQAKASGVALDQEVLNTFFQSNEPNSCRT